MANKNNKQVTLGVILIVAGTFLLLNKLHLFFLPWWMFTWQFLLIGIGAVLIITKEQWEPGVIMMTIGTAFLLPHVIDITWREIFHYWPVLLIVLGVVMLIKSIERNSKTQNNNNHG